MNKENFLLHDKSSLINASFIKEGWITIYESSSNGDNDSGLIYSCIIDSTKIESRRKTSTWEIINGSEGKPSVFNDGNYQTYADEGIEPFIFTKYFNFSNGTDFYIDIAEEFILYFKLYEKGQNKHSRTFYFIDELGDLEDVIKIEPKSVVIKLKFLKEYLSIRKVYLSVCFDFMRMDFNNLREIEIEPMDRIYEGKDHYYTHLIRDLNFSKKGKIQSWIHGKLFINPDKNKTKSYHSNFENQENAEFIVGYDEDGNEIYQSCKRDRLSPLVVTYFKRDVLDKYYNDPIKYKVDSWHVNSKFFTLKIDNNVHNYVPVFLNELGSIPYREQLHWKQYNIGPQEGISGTYYKTMIEGEWVDFPETHDLVFKQKYEQFNSKWSEKYGWPFYKALAKEDLHLFTSLHIPTANNVKAFCEQILAITKITIDRLNEKELGNNPLTEKGDRGITKLERFLKSKDIEIPDMFIFLRSLWDLRSGLLSHSFSNTNKDCKAAIKYFNLKDDNYVEVAKEIFEKSIFTLNSLENKLLSHAD
jgi:hypothetical protein